MEVVVKNINHLVHFVVFLEVGFASLAVAVARYLLPNIVGKVFPLLVWTHNAIVVGVNPERETVAEDFCRAKFAVWHQYLVFLAASE